MNPWTQSLHPHHLTQAWSPADQSWCRSHHVWSSRWQAQARHTAAKMEIDKESEVLTVDPVIVDSITEFQMMGQALLTTGMKGYFKNCHYIKSHGLSFGWTLAERKPLNPAVLLIIVRLPYACVWSTYSVRVVNEGITLVIAISKVHHVLQPVHPPLAFLGRLD